MQLITTLMMAVAVLTILSGISTLCGSKKQNKTSAVWFFLTTIGLAVWSTSISMFLSLAPDQIETAKVLIVGIICGITLADMGIIGYAGWKYTLGKIMFIILLAVGAGVVGILIKDPGVFYSSISLNNTCNQMEVVKGWYYILLMVYYAINTFTFLGFLLYTIRHTNNRNTKIGLKVFYVGLSVCGVLSLVFDLILLSSVPQFIWVGPMAISITMLCYYYSVVRYKVIILTSRWMRIMSNMILAVSGVILYLIVFYLVFMALFKIPNPTPAVLILNLVMVVIVLCLVPAITEISALMRSRITGQINVGYVVKNLDKLQKQKFNLKELADFLADHLHYDYVRFVINGRVYGSGSLAFSADEIRAIEKLDDDKNTIWQEIPKDNDACDDLGITAVAKLVNTKGVAFGQIVFGRPDNKIGFDCRDLIKVEMIVRLTAATIDSKKHMKD